MPTGRRREQGSATSSKNLLYQSVNGLMGLIQSAIFALIGSKWHSSGHVWAGTVELPAIYRYGNDPLYYHTGCIEKMILRFSNANESANS